MQAIPKWINRLTTTGAHFWDKAVFSQRIYDRVATRSKSKAAAGASENGSSAAQLNRADGRNGSEVGEPGKVVEKNVARLGPSVPLEKACGPAPPPAEP